jgi:hypothetical protein
VRATYVVKTPANRATKEFMRLYDASVKMQAVFRRKLGIRHVALMLREKEAFPLGGNGGE